MYIYIYKFCISYKTQKEKIVLQYAVFFQNIKKTVSPQWGDTEKMISISLLLH